jgi:HK97 family phage prohead protease
MSRLLFTATPTFDVQAADGEGKPKRPTFKIHAYTGKPMSVGAFWNPVVVDLGGLKASRPKIPILLGHDPDRIIGQSDEIEIDSEGVRIAGTITGEDVDAEKVISHAKNGFLWQASIGADIIRREFLESGKKTVVNGREVSGPLLIAREALLVETSFVAIGADQQTSASVAALGSPGLQSGANTMFEAWLEAKGFDPAALTDQQKSILRAAYDAEQNPPSPPPPPPSSSPPETRAFTEVIEARRQETSRVNEITALVERTINERPFLTDEVGQMGQSAIEMKTPFKDFKLAILELRAEAGTSPMVLTRSNPDLGPKMLEATVCRSLNLPGLEKHFDEKTLNASDRAYPRGIKLGELLLMAARENGYQGYALGDMRDVLEAAFARAPRRDIRAASQFSTLSLPGILSNVANKFIRDSFMAVENAWRGIAEVERAEDFKAMTIYSLTGDLTFKKVGPAGEIEHGTLGELSYSNQVDTYALMMAITRKDIINDDLAALTRIPRRLGRGAALKLNDVFWTEFLNNGSFFTTAQGNAIEGATPGTNDTRLNMEGLERAEVAFAGLTDPDGRPIGTTPQILLVPTSLKNTALTLMSSQEIGNTNSSTVFGTTNVFANRYRVVSSQYMNNSSFTGYSATAWYLLASPADMPVIQIAFLQGREMPVIESADADFNTLGIQYRGYFDFGVNLQEYRGGVRAKGAAA